MSFRFRFCLTTWIAVIAIAAVCGTVQAQDSELTFVPVVPAAEEAAVVTHETAPPAGDWVISVVPAAKVQPTPGTQPAASGKYSSVYKSIPFNRAEYNVNPSYRHDSAMEILTGNARHTTIVRHNSAPQVRRQPVRNIVGNPYQYGYLRPALRLNYYKNFPSMNPYVNIWNYSGAY